MIKLLKFVFYISVLLLIIISLYPGSLIGLLFYGDLSLQPNLVKNPFGSTINHFLAYFYISLLGFSLYLEKEKLNLMFRGLIFLSIFLEVFQFIVPNRSFQIGDLIGNIFGVVLAYFVIKIYLWFKRYG